MMYLHLGVLLVFSLGAHFAQLSFPNEVVFDEVHWGKYISAYCCTHKNFFDVHPPLGKLLVAYAAKFSGYAGDQNFETIGLPYQQVSAFALRFFPALAGALIPLVIYQILITLRTHRRVALLGGLMLIFENGLMVQSRLMGLYPLLLLSLLVSFFFLTQALQTNGIKRYAGLGASGIFSSAAVALQFTGLVALALGVLAILGQFSPKKSNFGSLIKQGFSLIIPALLFYLLCWVFHFKLLTLPGQGDLFYKYTGNFWTDLIELHQIMFTASYNLTTSHPDGSPWWSWPLMLTPIFYWVKSGRSIYFIGNPFVWWGISALFVFFTAYEFIKYRSLKKYGLPFLGFMIAFLPLIQMHRVLFLYHFLTPLVYALIFVLIRIPKVWAKKNTAYFLLVFCTLIGFLWLAPVTYGFSMPNWYWQTLPWNLVH